jgi:hypothetical protein
VPTAAPRRVRISRLSANPRRLCWRVCLPGAVAGTAQPAPCDASGGRLRAVLSPSKGSHARPSAGMPVSHHGPCRVPGVGARPPTLLHRPTPSQVRVCGTVCAGLSMCLSMCVCGSACVWGWVASMPLWGFPHTASPRLRGVTGGLGSHPRGCRRAPAGAAVWVLGWQCTHPGPTAHQGRPHHQHAVPAAGHTRCCPLRAPRVHQGWATLGWVAQ